MNLEEYNKKIEDRKSFNFINCPENNFNFFYVYSDNQLYKIGSAGIADEKPSTSLSIKEVVMVKSEIQNNVCVKNRPLLY